MKSRLLMISAITRSIDHPADIGIIESGIYVLIAAPQVGRTSCNVLFITFDIIQLGSI